jgi:hypothetical protein
MAMWEKRWGTGASWRCVEGCCFFDEEEEEEEERSMAEPRRVLRKETSSGDVEEVFGSVGEGRVTEGNSYRPARRPCCVDQGQLPTPDSRPPRKNERTNLSPVAL